MIKSVEKWGMTELEFKGHIEGNPFLEAKIKADFVLGGRKVSVNGFYNGNDEYKIRFMPDTLGQWEYEVESNIVEIDGLKGSFECVEASEGNHGPVRVINRYNFAYEDGTPYRPIGTTCYAWAHQGKELEGQTVETLKNAPFNKMRMCVFPKDYDYNKNEPEYYPFDGSLKDGWDYTRFNPEYFEHFESCILSLMELNIEADIIVFHPYDRWGFSKMPKEADDRYLEYITARFSAYRNVWWSLANEYDFMTDKTLADWDRFFRIIEINDPYHHLRSIHNAYGFYDHSKHWVTHCSVQNSYLERVSDWLDEYKKPVVVDECCYEGNISLNWGNITALEMVNRMWEAYSRGGFAGHGETYLNDEEVLWWSRGGKLYGQSPARIQFLVDIINQAPGHLVPYKLCVDTTAAVGCEDKYFISYIGNRQVRGKNFNLPEGKKYKAEVIDVWDMTITPADGVFKGKCTVPTSQKPYLAVRFIEV